MNPQKIAAHFPQRLLDHFDCLQQSRRRSHFYSQIDHPDPLTRAAALLAGLIQGQQLRDLYLLALATKQLHRAILSAPQL